MQAGSYGKSFEVDVDTPAEMIKEILWEDAQREIDKFFQQGATEITNVRLIVGERCDAPTYDPEVGFDPEQYDEDDWLGCSPSPHRHCAWKCKVAV